MAELLSMPNAFLSTDKTQKLTIRVADQDFEAKKVKLDPVQVLFNPTEYTLDHTITWKEQETVEAGADLSQFIKGDAQKLSFELLIDTTGEPVRTPARDAGRIADQLMRFAEVHGEVHRPPICTLAWGKRIILDRAVFESVKRTMVLFDGDGTPTRIKMSCSVKRFKVPADANRETKTASPDRTRTIAVEQGDTLPAIAFRAYGDASLWRSIVTANRLEDPSRLRPGTILSVPRLEVGGD